MPWNTESHDKATKEGHAKLSATHPWRKQMPTRRPREDSVCWWGNWWQQGSHLHVNITGIEPGQLKDKLCLGSIQTMEGLFGKLGFSTRFNKVQRAGGARVWVAGQDHLHICSSTVLTALLSQEKGGRVTDSSPAKTTVMWRQPVLRGKLQIYVL